MTNTINDLIEKINDGNMTVAESIDIDPAQAVTDGVALLVNGELHPDPSSNGHAYVTTLSATISSGPTLTIGKKYYAITVAVHETVHALDDKRRAMAVKLYNNREHSVAEICQTMGISGPTLYSYVRKARSQ